MARLMLLLVAAAAMTLLGAAADSSVGMGTGDALDKDGEPWRTGERERTEEHLKDVLTSLGQVRKAEATAADHERDVGSRKLNEAKVATHEATKFMAKAEKLLSSEEALKAEQTSVERHLDELEDAHRNVKLWQDCSDGDHGCLAGNSRDEWEKEEQSEHRTDLQRNALDRLRDLSSLKNGHDEARGKTHWKARGKTAAASNQAVATEEAAPKVPPRMTRPPRNEFHAEWSVCATEGGQCKCPGGTVRYGVNGAYAPIKVLKTSESIGCSNEFFGDPVAGSRKACECMAPFDSRPEGHPYGDYQWKDEKPAVSWSDVKRGALKAGYDLSNCFVAAAKDPAQVTVKVVNSQEVKKNVQKTLEGCTCQMPWKYYKEAEVVDGVIVEAQEASELNRCSMNGSDKPWCATDSDTCGTVSTDAHAGHGEGKYGWTRWDYCQTEKDGVTPWPTPVTQQQKVVVWESTHSAGEVSCLANFFMDSDRSLEWRALDLLRQEAGDDWRKRRDALAPPELASRYEQCITRADVGGSAVYCAADLLRHLQPAVVRHALLISRADRVGVHWANRARVSLLYARQLQSCLKRATDATAGIVCMSQMLSSMASKVAQRGLINAMDIPETGKAPQEVSELTAQLVRCIRAATDDDAEGFCVATFLAHVPRKTLLAVKRVAERARAFGTVGFADYSGGAGSGLGGQKGVLLPGKSVKTGWVGLEDANLQGHFVTSQSRRGRFH